MEELKNLLKEKRFIYTYNLKIATELNQKTNIIFYQKCISKIENCIDIINQ
jgi:hypothetical protein